MEKKNKNKTGDEMTERDGDSLLTELVEDTPVSVVNRKPLTIPRANVDVDRAEVVVLLVSWGSGPRHLHVQLHRVHAHNSVPNVGQEVRLRACHLEREGEGKRGKGDS